MSMFDYNPDDLDPEARARYDAMAADNNGHGILKAVDFDDQPAMQRGFEAYLDHLDDTRPLHITELDAIGGRLLVLNEGFKAGYKAGMYAILAQLGTLIGSEDKPRGHNDGI